MEAGEQTAVRQQIAVVFCGPQLNPAALTGRLPCSLVLVKGTPTRSEGALYGAQSEKGGAAPGDGLQAISSLNVPRIRTLTATSCAVRQQLLLGQYPLVELIHSFRRQGAPILTANHGVPGLRKKPLTG